MIYQKEYTVKQWKKFNKIVEFVPDDPKTNKPYQFYNFITKRFESYDFMTMQEILLNKYDIILTGYKVNPILNYKDLSKKDLAVKIAKNFNMKNFNKGMKIFNEGVKGFTDSIDAVTSQLGSNDGKNKKLWSDKSKNKVKIWSDKKQSQKKNHVKIWSDPPTKKRKYRRKPVQDRHKQNLQSIWGNK